MDGHAWIEITISDRPTGTRRTHMARSSSSSSSSSGSSSSSSSERRRKKRKREKEEARRKEKKRRREREKRRKEKRKETQGDERKGKEKRQKKSGEEAVPEVIAGDFIYSVRQSQPEEVVMRLKSRPGLLTIHVPIEGVPIEGSEGDTWSVVSTTRGSLLGYVVLSFCSLLVHFADIEIRC